MAVNLSPIGGVAGQFFDNNGSPLTGGKIYTYASGTTTPLTTYTGATGASAHTNPIILDAAGRVPGGEIWLTDGLQYKFVIKTSADVLIGTYDNIVGINSNFVNYTNQEEIQTATAGQTVFTLTTMQYQPGTGSLSVFVDGVNQYDGVSYAFVETDSTTVTFTSGLHVGALVKFTTSAINASSYGDAFQISYTPPFTDSVPTNVGDKLAQIVSVKDFGAVGDGVTDDTVAIQAAIDSLTTSGGAVYVPTGQYLLTNTIKVLNGNIAIYGDGASSNLKTSDAITMLAFSNTSDLSPSYVQATFLKGSSLKNIGFVGASNTADGLYVNGVVNGLFENLYFSTLNKCVYQKHADTCVFDRLTTPDIEDTALDSNYIVYSDGLVRSNDNIYRNITMRALQDGIYLDAGAGSHDGANIQDNIIFRCDAGAGIYVDKARWSTISNNKVFITSGAASIYLNEPFHVNVTGNLIAWPGYNRTTITHGIYVRSGAGSLATAPSDIVVANNQVIQPTGHGIFVENMSGVVVADNAIGSPSDTQYWLGSPTNLYGYNGINLQRVGKYTIVGNNVYAVLSGTSGGVRPVTWLYSASTDANCRDGFISANNFDNGRIFNADPEVPTAPKTQPQSRLVRAIRSVFSPYTTTGYSNITANAATLSTTAIASGYPVESPATATAVNVAFPAVSSTVSVVERGGNSSNIGEIVKASCWIKTTSASPKLVTVYIEPNGGVRNSMEIVVNSDWQYVELVTTSTVSAGFSRLGFGSYIAQDAFDIQIAEAQTNNTILPVYPVQKVAYDATAPSAGYWTQGDIVWNTSPSAGGAPGWMCVTSGTPGTWKAMANLAV